MAQADTQSALPTLYRSLQSCHGFTLKSLSPELLAARDRLHGSNRLRFRDADQTRLPFSRTLWGHPIGLYPLFFTEMWERFGFYLMIAVLPLYLSDSQKGGFGWTDAMTAVLSAVITAWCISPPSLAVCWPIACSATGERLWPARFHDAWLPDARLAWAVRFTLA